MIGRDPHGNMRQCPRCGHWFWPTCAQLHCAACERELAADLAAAQKGLAPNQVRLGEHVISFTYEDRG